jgi:hypothetical protein
MQKFQIKFNLLKGIDAKNKNGMGIGIIIIKF